MSEQALYNLEKLYALSDGNSEFVTHMVNMFVKMVPDFQERISNSYDSGDLKDVGDAAHKIKPSLDMMGIDSLYQPIRDLEKEGRSGEEPAKVQELMAEVSQTLDRVCEQLKRD